MHKMPQQKNLQKSSGSIDRGNLGAIALNAERREI